MTFTERATTLTQYLAPEDCLRGYYVKVTQTLILTQNQHVHFQHIYATRGILKGALQVVNCTTVKHESTLLLSC